MIDHQTLHKLATLARLEIKAADIDKLSQQLSKIIDYANTLNALDLSGVEPTSHAVAVQNVFRADHVQASDVIDRVLQAAPHADPKFFRVPKVL